MAGDDEASVQGMDYLEHGDDSVLSEEHQGVRIDLKDAEANAEATVEEQEEEADDEDNDQEEEVDEEELARLEKEAEEKVTQTYLQNIVEAKSMKHVKEDELKDAAERTRKLLHMSVKLRSGSDLDNDDDLDCLLDAYDNEESISTDEQK